MPLFDDATRLMRVNFEQIKKGIKARIVVIGCLTADQLAMLNAERAKQKLPAMNAEVVFMGRHIYDSRITRDGYTVDDVIAQITNAMDGNSTFHANPKMNALVSPTVRDDGYGNQVIDTAVFECTAKYPRPELYSVIPKGVNIKSRGPKK